MLAREIRIINWSKWKKDSSIRNKISKTSGNQRTKWKCLNKILPNKKKKQINSEIIFESIPITNEEDISNKFNEFFIDSILNINSQIPNENLNIESTTHSGTFKFKHIKVERLQSITIKLTKKVNKSQIRNSIVWHDAVDYLGHHLCTIINKSFDEGHFPECWKISTITPIPKVKNTNKCEEFRPINSMPNDEKIIEWSKNN